MHSRGAVFVGIVALVLLPGHLLASITTYDDVFPPYIPPGNWIVGGTSLKVGNTLVGGIRVDSGSSVSVTGDWAYFGFGSSAVGTGTITGTGSLLETPYGVGVGVGGVGVLDVNEGGQVTDQYGLIGMSAGSTGTVRVMDTGTLWSNSGALGVGAWGTGNLAVANGGIVNGAEIFIGGVPINLLGGSDPNLEPNGTGTVAVSGSGSRLQVTGPAGLYVGYYGDGTLDVNDGGAVTTNLAVLGGAPDANGVVTVRDAGSTLQVNTDMVVGAWGNGSLTISNGGQVSASGLYIGGFDANQAELDPNMVAQWGGPNGTGQVTVTGTGSMLTDVETLVVGGGGTGALTVAAGGQATSVDGFIGGAIRSDYNDVTMVEDMHFSGGTGSALVTGEGSTWQSNTLVVGTGGAGTLTVADSGRVDSYLGGIGLGPQSTGTVTVTGPNSVWTVTEGDTSGGDPYYGTLMVGGWGTGQLTVANGGRVEAVAMYIGGFDLGELGTDLNWGMTDPNGTGTATVTGAGSELVVGGGPLYVGYRGEGTLNILNGGRVESLAGVVGALEGSTGRVLVDGEGSTWSITGGASPMDALGDGDVTIANGGLVDVNGPSATLNVGDAITVGSDGQGTLLIANGGLVNSTTGIIGGYDPQYETVAEYFDPNATLGTGSGSVTVTSGSTWNTQDLVVGFSHGGTLTIDNSEVYDSNAVIGLLPGAVGTATVTGPSAYWESWRLAVGGWGRGNLTIADGAYVYADEVFIGGLPLEMLGEDFDPNLVPNGTGKVTVTGAGSYLETAGPSTLYVGYSGNGTLDVNEGGQAYAESAVIGGAPGVNGVVTVHDADSRLDISADLLVGAWGRGELTVSEGGTVATDTLTIGGFDVNDAMLDPNMVAAYGDAEGTGVVTVTGLNSYLSAPGGMVIGYTGQGTLNVLDAGYAETNLGVAGFLPGSRGQVVVDGNDATWQANTAVIGMYGQGFLTISNGGYVTNTDSYVGGYDPCALEPQYVSDWGDPNGTGTVLVTGANSRWGNAGTLYLGYAGDGQMAIQAGGTVQDTRAILGLTPDSIGQAYVMGPNSVWQHSEDLVLGARGIGTLSVTAGGTVEDRHAFVGGFDPAEFGFAPGTAQGTGAVLVSGAGSTWTNTGDLLVGYYGTGTVDVNDGGHVTSVNGYIGHAEGSQGAVHVAGTGSIWDVSEDLYLGGDAVSAGGPGLLSVRDGGLVTVGGTLWIRPVGTLMGNGTIDAPVVDNYGTIAPGNSIGTLTVNGDVKFEPNSVLAVEIGGGSSSDKLVATGSVDIVGGTVQAISTGTIVGSHRYEIVEANSVTGTFDAVDTALLNFYFNDIGVDYDPNSVWLWVDATRFDDPNIARTNNEREVGEALQQIAEGGGTEITDALQQLADFNDIRHAYDQLAGQSRPPLAPVTVSATSKFLGTVANRAQTLQTGLYAMSDSSLFAMSGPESGMDGGRVGQAPRRGQTFAVGRGSQALSDRKWGVWGQGYGLFGDRETPEAGMPGYTYSMYGGSMGADYQFSETFLLGLVGGYSTGEVEFSSLRDNTDITATHFGAYGSYAWDKWYADAVASYVGLKYDTERFVDLLSERLTGSFDGTEIAAYVEVGYDWELAPHVHAQPLASVQYTHLSLDSYTESGGASALAFEEQTYDSIKGALGARVTETLVESAGGFRADVQLRGRWVHEFGDDHSTVDATFVNSPAAVFTVEDKAISRESVVLGAGLYADLNKQTRVFLDYDTRLNRDESINVFSAALQYRW